MVNPDGRINLDSYSVYGTTTPTVPVELDYTHPEVAQAFADQIAVINSIFTRVQTSPPDPNFITQADATAVSTALTNLTQLAQNGILVAGTDPQSYTGISQTYYLTKDMASNLDLILRSFKATGASDFSTLTVAQLQEWRDLSVTSSTIQDALSVATNAVTQNRSLQSLIELEYVATANGFINDKLSSLEQALTATQSVLTSLNNLQDIRNRLTIKTPGTFSATVGRTGTGTGDSLVNYQVDYKTSANQYFNTPIIPKLSSALVTYNANFSNPVITSRGMQTFQQLLTLKKSLLALIPQLSTLATSGALTDPNSLYNRVKTIVSDFNTAFITYSGPATVMATSSFTAVQQVDALQRFLLDNNNPSELVAGRAAGDSQANLTLAITSAENLNDTQKQAVSQFLYVFEEYYKSASSILQRLSDIIEKMAQNISR